MYEIYSTKSKTEKIINEYILTRQDIRNKIVKLKYEPRRANGAHPLHGKLKGKWACWLGYNLRMIYTIDDENERIIVEAVGTHKIY